MRRRLLFTVLVLPLAVLGAACEEAEFEPPDRARQVRQAEGLYSSALFDTIQWASDSVRALEGNSVFSAKCRQCHGPLGRGGTDYAIERGLDVPSLVEPDWEHADDLEGVRRQMFVGHPEGMPTWGVAGITLREVDATAFYIVHQLRPDVIEEGAELPGGSTGG